MDFFLQSLCIDIFRSVIGDSVYKYNLIYSKFTKIPLQWTFIKLIFWYDVHVVNMTVINRSQRGLSQGKTRVGDHKRVRSLIGSPVENCVLNFKFYNFPNAEISYWRRHIFLMIHISQFIDGIIMWPSRARSASAYQKVLQTIVF